MGNQYSFLYKAMASENTYYPLNECVMIGDPAAASDRDRDEDRDTVMSAVIYRRHGTPDECLELVDNLSRPIPSPGQILVKVHAYGINPLDVRLLDNPNQGKQETLRKV